MIASSIISKHNIYLKVRFLINNHGSETQRPAPGIPRTPDGQKNTDKPTTRMSPPLHSLLKNNGRMLSSNCLLLLP